MTPGIERTSACRASHRLNQYPVEPEVAAGAKLLDTNLHTFVPLRGLGNVGAEEPVPPRQIEAEIRIGLARINGMVDPVRVRGDDDPSEDTVHRTRQINVGVVEECSCVEDHLEQEYGDGRRPQGRNDRQLDPHRDQDFYWVKAQASGRVEVEIGVVHDRREDAGPDGPTSRRCRAELGASTAYLARPFRR